MSSPKLEEFLAQLYTDVHLRERFLQDQVGTASSAALTADEVSALCQIDLAGLQMAAASYANKRESRRRRSWWQMLMNVNWRGR
ncbi:hypothetical protein AAKU67_004376 [Oxalobacteraceae bacterium GrIS 2.11]